MEQTEAFQEYLLLEKKYAALTVSAYTSDLIEFSSFCKVKYEQVDLNTITYSQIRTWIVSLIDGGVSNRTVNRKIASLKCYYKFLLRSGQIQEYPLLKHKALKTPKKIQIPFSIGEVANVLASQEADMDFRTLRDVLLIELLYGTGMRRAELVGIKINDLDFYNKQVKIKGKREKERVMPLLPEVIAKIKEYLAARKKVLGNEEVPELFITEKGVKMYPTLVYRIINHYFSEASSKAKRSPHILRHSFATHLLSEGANLNAVKELLGHASLASTEVYTYQNIAQLSRIYESAHPRNKKEK